MLTTTYKIDGVYDRDGNQKDNKYRINRWFIKAIGVGTNAYLIDIDDLALSFVTSKVEDIKVLDNHIKITTKNSEYWLKPYAQGV